jgi:hypothetical protein
MPAAAHAAARLMAQYLKAGPPESHSRLNAVGRAKANQPLQA